jgi:glycyl-tRNA synthetase beta chain
MSTDTLLIEIGTEELPPTSLRMLAEAFAEQMRTRLSEERIAFAALRWFATPRRLALQIEQVSLMQPDAIAEKLGPAIAAAFDKEGKPTPAALGFARGCGVGVEQLLHVPGERGERLAFRQNVPGKTTAELLPRLVESALASLPVAKRMRWGALRAEFVRPVHWVILLFGSTVVPGTVLGITAGRETRGHRVHGTPRIALQAAADYEQTLLQTGWVIADYEARKLRVAEQVAQIAQSLGGTAVIDADLLEEVSSLVEWPQALAGRFEERFLEVPAEALISSMKQHQKYFHVVDANGALMPHFITVANIESSDPQKVVAGNERVIRPRLSDAAFFFAQDKQQTLQARRERLRSIVFQTELGSIWDKTERVAALARTIGEEIGADPDLCARAGSLCKSDLVSDMVQEFDDLQGVMGSYYALHDGEDPALARALTEQYLPRHAGDELARTPAGIALALADRLDTLVGIFGIGQAPTGSRDPFGLRRAALGVLRTLIENGLELDLQTLLLRAADLHRGLPQAASVVDSVRDYSLERLRAGYLDEGIAAECFLAVQARGITRPLDFDRRVRAVAAFTSMAEAPSLAAANKRVANILARQADTSVGDAVNPELLLEDAEAALAAAIDKRLAMTAPMLARADYAGVLRELSHLATPVDAFFDQVLVMCEDAALRGNRLALLSRLRSAFLAVADISVLATNG